MILPLILLAVPCVALRKESVDRNVSAFDVLAASVASLSARRAWIEMATALIVYLALIRSLSARRAWIEMIIRRCSIWVLQSLSARRAWIEIFYYADKDADWVVALRKESVDRN